MKLDGTVLGFDVGARRIGVAVGKRLRQWRSALAVIDVHAHGPDWTRSTACAPNGARMAWSSAIR
jgi:RNase H-fold protein (predicted Holliday junction resolvase)